MRFCSECGNLLVEGALFCSECGTRINKQHESQSFSSDEENQQSKPIQNDQDGTPSQEDHDNRPFDSEQNNNVNEPFNKQQYLSQSDEPPGQSSFHGTNHQNVPSGGEPPVQSPFQGIPSGPVPPKKPRKPLSKGAIISIISGAALIILFIVTHFVLNYIFSVERLIVNFEDALKEKDVDTLVDMLSADHKDVKIDKNAVEAYLGYFEDHSDEVEDVIRSLKQQAEGRKSSVHMAKLENDGKFLYFDKFKIVVPTGYIKVMTNVEGAKIFVNGEEVGESDEDYYEGTFGPFITGKHKVEAVLQTDFLELSANEEVVIYDDDKYFADLYIEAEEVAFYVPTVDPDVDIKLLINGKDVGVDLTEEDEFGPVLTDGSMTYAFEAELPWGTVRTEEQPLKENFIDVVLMDETLKSNLMDVAHNYQMEWIEAVTSENLDAITLGVEAIKDSVQVTIDILKSENLAVSFQYLSTIFDLNSFNLYYDKIDEVWVVELNARSTYLYNEFPVGQEPPELEEMEQDLTYILIYDEEQEKWLVEYYFDTWLFNDENTEEMKVDSPETFTAKWAN